MAGKKEQKLYCLNYLYHHSHAVEIAHEVEITFLCVSVSYTELL